MRQKAILDKLGVINGDIAPPAGKCQTDYVTEIMNFYRDNDRNES